MRKPGTIHYLWGHIVLLCVASAFLGLAIGLWLADRPIWTEVLPSLITVGALVFTAHESIVTRRQYDLDAGNVDLEIEYRPVTGFSSWGALGDFQVYLTNANRRSARLVRIEVLTDEIRVLCYNVTGLAIEEVGEVLGAKDYTGGRSGKIMDADLDIPGRDYGENGENVLILRTSVFRADGSELLPRNPKCEIEFTYEYASSDFAPRKKTLTVDLLQLSRPDA